MSIPEQISDVLAGRSRWCVVTGDCLDVLRTIPSQSIGLVLTDPPYGETSLPWDRVVKGWADCVASVLAPGGSMWAWGSLRSIMAPAHEFSEWKFAQDIIWQKHNGSNFLTDRFRRVHEIATHWYRGDWSAVYKQVQYTNDAKKRTLRRKTRPPHMGSIDPGVYVSDDGGPRMMCSVFQVRTCHGHAEHPMQKPTGVLTPLVQYSCPDGEIVLDPFCGSGSIGVACMQTGRRFIGIEIDPGYANIARRRIGEAANHLFANTLGQNNEPLRVKS